jgi:hypothetical protein
MMFFFILITCCVTFILVEIILFAAQSKMNKARLVSAKEAFSSFRVADNDDDRQKYILRCGLNTLFMSLFWLGVVGIVIIIVFASPLLFDSISRRSNSYYISISVLGVVWIFLRKKLLLHLPSEGERGIESSGRKYSLFDQIFHRLVLGLSIVRKVTFDVEKSIFLRENEKNNEIGGAARANGPVYICGLARSGTTILLRLLHQLGPLRSLTYRDMPFILGPNLWKKIKGNREKQMEVRERAHGDGILIDYDSPESFEEIFWDTFNPYKVQGQNCLESEVVRDEVLKEFAFFRRLAVNPNDICAETGLPYRYLSKNNNNLLRLKVLCKDEAAVVFVVYRNPYSTARSLYRQHCQFMKLNEADNFTVDYMKWLGHYEFGENHLPFCFAWQFMEEPYAPETLNYWLMYWIGVHKHIQMNLDLPLTLLNHDKLRAFPDMALNKISEKLRIKGDVTKLAGQIKQLDVQELDSEGFDPNLAAEAEMVYMSLQKSQANII